MSNRMHVDEKLLEVYIRLQVIRDDKQRQAIIEVWKDGDGFLDGKLALLEEMMRLLDRLGLPAVKTD